MEALSHLRPTVGQQHRAVGVDVNQSSSLQTQIQTHDKNQLCYNFQFVRQSSHLVEARDSEAEAKLGGDNGEASFGPPVLPDRKEQKLPFEEPNLHSTSTLYITHLAVFDLL